MRQILTWTALSLLAGFSACGRSDRVVIQNKGSDTMGEVAQRWAEEYQKVDPTVSVAVSASGSGTGIAALIDGNVDIANSSRRLKPEEIERAKANGIEPVEHIVGHDAIGVYVHKDNPIESLTLEQLAEIYGEGGKIERWSQLGVTIPGARDDKIIRVSRQNSSGTYAYFREAVLGKNRDYKLGSLDLHGSKDVVEHVGKTKTAIGYSGIAYANDEVRLVPIAGRDGGPAVAPSIDTALNGTYPISRPLLMYTRGQPTGKVKEYLDWILSDAGQRILMDLGYPPVRKLD